MNESAFQRWEALFVVIFRNPCDNDFGFVVCLRGPDLNADEASMIDSMHLTGGILRHFHLCLPAPVLQVQVRQGAGKHFPRFEFSLPPSRVHSRPSASNANRWPAFITKESAGKKTVKILASLEKQNKSLLVFVGSILIGLTGLINYSTGHDFAFSVFYVLPISLITWFTNKWFGLVASIACAIVWVVADLSPAQSSLIHLIPFWNPFIRLAFFIIITFLLSSLKSSLDVARTDYLTSAINSRYYYEIVQMEINRFQRNQRPFTVAYIDIDNFKAVNDQLGHTVGNQVLITFVNSITKVIRKSDFIARLGGDEFAMLFPETDQEASRIIFSKIQTDIKEVMRQKNWSITFSVGVLTCGVAPHTTDELIRMADGLMYLAKSDGKNTVKYSVYAG